MPKVSKIKYNPSLSVSENAKINGCSEDGIRYYIKSRGINRRGDAEAIVANAIRKVLKKKPEASKNEVARQTGYCIGTIRSHWGVATGEEKPRAKSGMNRTPKINIRQYNNFYATHPSCVCDLLEVEDFDINLLEPFCGIGSISRVLEAYGHKVESYDIKDRGYGKVGDFFKVNYPKRTFDIISNPAYDNLLNLAIPRCIDICKKKVALLMPLRYLSGEARFKDIYKKYPPSRIYVYQNRICIAKDGDFAKYDAGSNTEIYAWYIWDKDYDGETIIRWIQNYGTIDERKIKYASILNGVDFFPDEEHEYQATNCIIFHSQAAPENRVLSNHHDCIIKFRGVEFYGVEQLFHMLQYSDSPEAMRAIMSADSTTQAKSICKNKFPNRADWDAVLKEYNDIAICHLFKYLTYKPFRDRLQETYPTTLIENPRGGDDHFGVIQNLDTNLFIGNNCSGRTMMYVRDLMREKEIEILAPTCWQQYDQDEVDNFLDKHLYKPLAKQMEEEPQIKKESQKMIDFILSEGISVTRPKHPEYQPAPEKDYTTKCLLLDFDNTLFDTSADDKLRKYCDGERDWDKILDCIPKYKLYDGWLDVIKWAKGKGIKLGIISTASNKLINNTLDYFGLKFDAVIGDRWGYPKPSPLLVTFALDEMNMNIVEDNILYVGDSLVDEKMARGARIKFVGSTWGSKEKSVFEKGIKTVNNPRDIIDIIKNW